MDKMQIRCKFWGKCLVSPHYIALAQTTGKSPLPTVLLLHGVFSELLPNNSLGIDVGACYGCCGNIFTALVKLIQLSAIMSQYCNFIPKKQRTTQETRWSSSWHSSLIQRVLRSISQTRVQNFLFTDEVFTCTKDNILGTWRIPASNLSPLPWFRALPLIILMITPSTSSHNNLNYGYSHIRNELYVHAWVGKSWMRQL
jgi:hypothetical protein